MSSLQIARPTLVNMGDEERVARGREIERRRLALGMDVAPFAKRAGINRATLKDVEAGAPSVRDTTWAIVERTLDELDHEWSPAVPQEPGQPSTVRFVVRGVYGAEALVVEGPVEDIAALEQSVDRIMRRLRGNGDEG